MHICICRYTRKYRLRLIRIRLNREYLAYLFIYVYVCVSVLFGAFIDITVGWAANYIEHIFEFGFFFLLALFP